MRRIALFFITEQGPMASSRRYGDGLEYRKGPPDNVTFARCSTGIDDARGKRK
jgi:hypothetical protein